MVTGVIYTLFQFWEERGNLEDWECLASEVFDIWGWLKTYRRCRNALD